MPLDPLEDQSSLAQRVFQLSKTVPLIVFWVLALIGLNVLQTLSLVLMPISRQTFRRFNSWCAGTWWGGCVLYAEKVNRTRIVITGEIVPDRENALVVSNHQQMPDITIIMAFARSKRRLGDLKFFVKQAIKWVPGVGWGMQFINCPFVRRNWTADKNRIRGTFETLVREDIPLWMVSFVEGTRSTKEKIKRSQGFAEARGREILQHVLNPRTKGFTASVQGLGDHITAVYDLTIGYEEGVPNLWQYLTGAVNRVHLHVRRFPIENLPSYERELADWLNTRFVEKDQLLDHFYQHGSFPAETATLAPE
ncbi:MAG: acyltransferase [bacterium]|nr:acyltransferase [bacterium]